MLARTIACILLPAIALSQSNDVFHRLQTTLSPAASGELVSSAIANRDFPKLEQMLDSLTPRSDAERSEVLALRAALGFLDGKMAAAVSDFQKASSLGALTDSDAFTFAMALINVGAEGQARPLLATLAQKYPTRAIYTYWLGRIDYSQRRYQEAVGKLKRAAELDSESARVWDSLGLALDMQGLNDQALEAFQKAAKLNRELARPSPWPPQDLGFLLLRMDQLKEAEASLREAIRYDAKLAEAHYHLGRALEKQARDTEAIVEYRSAIVTDTASADACYSLAMLYRKLHREADATSMFAEYKKRKQANPEGITPQ